MSTRIDPTTLDLLVYTDRLRTQFKEVTTGQITDANAKFHPDGLFSVEIFGRVGSEQRSSTFGLIDLKVRTIHPTVFNAILKLGSKYLRIMEGKEMVIFDERERDFVTSDSPLAQTGYSYFIKYLPKIKFKETSSDKRKFRIELVEKAIKEGTILTSLLMVIPAGMRDYFVKEDGKPEEDEINTFYRKILSRASIIDPIRAKQYPEFYDEAAMGIQKAVAELWDYIFNLNNGKYKLPQSKFISRRVFNTTSNVLSSYVNTSTGNSDPRKMDYNDVRVGLYQYCRSAAPMSLYNIKNKYIRDIFPDESQVGYLTNMKTLKKERVYIGSMQKDVDLWTKPDGLEKVIASLGNPDVRDEVIKFKNRDDRDKIYCLGLLYRDKKHFRFFQDIDEVPQHLDRRNVKPITLYEFIYISLYEMSGKYPGLLTRYPVTGNGSIYPANVVLITTVTSEILVELDSNWESLEDVNGKALFFPVTDSEVIGTIVISPKRLGGLGGDQKCGINI